MVAGGLVGLVLGGALIAAAAVPLPSGAPSLHLRLVLSTRVGSGPTVPFPSQGESAVAVPTLGFSDETPDQRAQPIASLTKLMTAYVTLHELPLVPTASGPSIVVNADDVTVYRNDVRTNQSNVKIAVGEVLDERQLLEGLLIPSANDFAVLLAEMVTGSESQMVADMNADAVKLGLHATTYADVSGYDPATQSDAIDQLHLAEILMRDRTFARIVRLAQVWLPVAGIVVSYTPEIGKPGVVGVKSGYTSEAGACDVMAFDKVIGTHEVQVLAVVLGQYSLVTGRTNLMAAGRAALVLTTGTIEHLHAWNLVTARGVVGTIGWGSQTVPVVALATLNVPVFSSIGASARLVEARWPSSHVPRGHTLATVYVTSGAYRMVTRLVSAATLARATLWQRLR